MQSRLLDGIAFAWVGELIAVAGDECIEIGVPGVAQDLPVFLALPLKLGDVRDLVPNQDVPQRPEDLDSSVLVDEDPHYPARCTGS